jgi:hypothetical protein
LQSLVAGHVALPELLQRVARVLRARALRVEVGLFVAAAGDVVLEQPAHARLLVEAREDRHDHQALHRRRQIHADHLAQPVGLALQREVLALDLLVVLELGLEELGHLHRRAGGAGDADAGQLVGLEDLLDAAAGDLIARGRLAIAGHDHAVTEAHRKDRRAVDRFGQAGRLRTLVTGDEMRRLAAKYFEEAGIRIVVKE